MFGLNSCFQVIYIRRKRLTGLAAVAAPGRDVPELLNQRTEEFAGFQSVSTGPLPPARVRRSVGWTKIQRRGFAQAAVQQLHFPSLVGLQLRDLPQVPGGQRNK